MVLLSKPESDPYSIKQYTGFRGFFQNVGIVAEHAQITFEMVRRGQINLREFWRHSYEAGWKSVPIVIITTMSIGMVSSLQLTKHFAAFGALSEIGGTNAIVQFRELSPVITAIVVIGRVGSAWAAEIGTMKITEQVNALKVMRVSLGWFLLTPRILACMLAMPILNLVAIFSSLFGGFLVAETISGVGITPYINSIHRYITGYDVIVTSLKSILFGLSIASISCITGLQARGGAAGVGNYTTKAVISAMIFIFAENYVLSYIFFNIISDFVGDF